MTLLDGRRHRKRSHPTLPVVLYYNNLPAHFLAKNFVCLLHCPPLIQPFSSLYHLQLNPISVNHTKNAFAIIDSSIKCTDPYLVSIVHAFLSSPRSWSPCANNPTATVPLPSKKRKKPQRINKNRSNPSVKQTLPIRGSSLMPNHAFHRHLYGLE